MPDLLLRRALLVLVAAGSLVVGGVVIRIAGDYTATAAPLTERPVSAEQITAEIDAERAAARTLRGRLTDVGDQITDLRGALDAMHERTGAEADAATRLAAELDAAEAKLAELERTLAASSVTTYQTVVVPAPATSVSSSSGEREDDDEDHEDHEDHEEEDHEDEGG